MSHTTKDVAILQTPKVLLVFEHAFEMKYFLELPFQIIKSKRLWKYSSDLCDWYIYSNNGDGFFALLHSLYTLQATYEFIAIVNMGIAGSLDVSLSVGNIFPVSSVIYHDLHTNRTFQAPKQCRLKMKNSQPLITVPVVTEGNCDAWKYFGTLIDMEGYFICQWGDRNSVPVLLIKQVSDYNENVRASIDTRITKGLAEYFLEHREEWEKIFTVPWSLEIYMALEFDFEANDIVLQLSQYFVHHHSSFSSRQKIYSQIRQNLFSFENNQKISLRTSSQKNNGYLLVEEDFSVSQYHERFSFLKPVSITNYLHYFMNKTQYGIRNIFIAQKKGLCVKKKPEGYGAKSIHHYSAVNAYNCMFDCSYCYLQGFFRSDDIVLFENKEAIVSQIITLYTSLHSQPIIIYFGDFCDALTFDTITKMSEFVSEHLIQYPRIRCEFRTKSQNYLHLRTINNHHTVVPAWTLSPQHVISLHEKGTATLDMRFYAIKDVVQWGYQVSVHVDPVIFYEGCVDDYTNLFERIVREIDSSRVLYISLGFLRMNRDTYRAISRDPQKAVITANLHFHEGMYRYSSEFRDTVTHLFLSTVVPVFGKEKVYVCME